MELNEKGKAAYARMEKNYNNERAWLETHPEDPYHDELGWCIIDNDDYVKNFEDECALLVFGYDDQVFFHLEEWAEINGWDAEYVFGHTTKEYYDEIRTYFTQPLMTSDLIKILQESMEMNGDLKVAVSLDHVTYDVGVECCDDTFYMEGYIEEPRR